MVEVGVEGLSGRSRLMGRSSNVLVYVSWTEFLLYLGGVASCSNFVLCVIRSVSCRWCPSCVCVFQDCRGRWLVRQDVSCIM